MPAPKVARHVLADPFVGLWAGIMFILFGLSVVLWNHQRVDADLRRIEAHVVANKAEADDNHRQIQAVRSAARKP